MVETRNIKIGMFVLQNIKPYASPAAQQWHLLKESMPSPPWSLQLWEGNTESDCGNSWDESPPPENFWHGLATSRWESLSPRSSSSRGPPLQVIISVPFLLGTDFCWQGKEIMDAYELRVWGLSGSDAHTVLGRQEAWWSSVLLPRCLWGLGSAQLWRLV